MRVLQLFLSIALLLEISSCFPSIWPASASAIGEATVDRPLEPALEPPSHNGLRKRRGGGGGGGRGGGGSSGGGGGGGSRGGGESGSGGSSGNRGTGGSSPPSYRYIFLYLSPEKQDHVANKRSVLPQMPAAKQRKDPAPREPTLAPAVPSTIGAAPPTRSPLSAARRAEYPHTRSR